MTLEEWSREAKLKPEKSPNRGHTFVVVEHEHPLRRALYNLTDYKISSVTADVYWLVPIAEDAQRVVKI